MEFRTTFKYSGFDLYKQPDVRNNFDKIIFFSMNPESSINTKVIFVFECGERKDLKLTESMFYIIGNLFGNQY